MFHKLCKKFSIVVSLSLSLFHAKCLIYIFFLRFFLTFCLLLLPPLFWFIEFFLRCCCYFLFPFVFCMKHGWWRSCRKLHSFRIYFRYDGIWKSYLWILVERAYFWDDTAKVCVFFFFLIFLKKKIPFRSLSCCCCCHFLLRASNIFSMSLCAFFLEFFVAF